MAFFDDFDLADGKTSNSEIIVGIGAGIGAFALLWYLTKDYRAAEINKMNATAHAIREGKLDSYAETKIQGGSGGGYYAPPPPIHRGSGLSLNFRNNPKNGKKRKTSKTRKNPSSRRVQGAIF